MSDLSKLLRIESHEIVNFFAKASIEGAGTPQEVADRREPFVREFLKKYFQSPAAVAKGGIVDTKGQKSASIDCVLLNPSHPKLCDTNGNISLILAEATDAAIEVKPDFSKKAEVTRALEQGLSVKKLHRNKNDVFTFSGPVRPFNHTIPFVVFSTKTFVERRKLVESIVEFYEAHSIPRILQFDIIVVLGLGIFLNVSEGSYQEYKDIGRGIYFQMLEHDTLGAFLMLLLKLPKSEPAIGSNPLLPYLNWNSNNFQTYHDLNRRLQLLD